MRGMTEVSLVPQRCSRVNEALAIVRAGWHNLQHYLRSTLQGILPPQRKKIRASYDYMLDPEMKDSEPATQVLLENVSP